MTVRGRTGRLMQDPGMIHLAAETLQHAAFASQADCCWHSIRNATKHVLPLIAGLRSWY